MNLFSFHFLVCVAVCYFQRNQYIFYIKNQTRTVRKKKSKNNTLTNIWESQYIFQTKYSQALWLQKYVVYTLCSVHLATQNDDHDDDNVRALCVFINHTSFIIVHNEFYGLKRTNNEKKKKSEQHARWTHRNAFFLQTETWFLRFTEHREYRNIAKIHELG